MMYRARPLCLHTCAYLRPPRWPSFSCLLSSLPYLPSLIDSPLTHPPTTTTTTTNHNFPQPQPPTRARIAREHTCTRHTHDARTRRIHTTPPPSPLYTHTPSPRAHLTHPRSRKRTHNTVHHAPRTHITEYAHAHACTRTTLRAAYSRIESSTMGAKETLFQRTPPPPPPPPCARRAATTGMAMGQEMCCNTQSLLDSSTPLDFCFIHASIE